MDSRKWLTVFTIAALAACAAARPGNEVVDNNKTKNDVNNKEVIQVTKPLKHLAEQAEQTLTQASPTPQVASLTPVVASPTPVVASPTPMVAVSKAVNEQYPHAVLFGGTCGGTIISPKWVLTAGHCTLFSNGRYVLAGTGNSEDGSGVERHVKRLVIHPRFTVGPYWLNADHYNIKQIAANWDFLLAELEEPLPLDNTTMAAVELDDGPSVPEGLEVGYAGYGAANHGDTMRHEMHGMELQVMADHVCERALPEYERVNMLCTKGRAPRYDSACNGDSGSGLVANNKLYGVASWVENDSHRCFNGALVVFSRVASVRDWIRQVTSI